MANTKPETVSLMIDNKNFTVDKDVLCEHSDYFRAMFSGNYIEQNKHEISIEVVDANSMDIIVRYMTLGLIDLAEYNLSTIGELAVAANFLQMIELTKQIEYCLEQQLSASNWLEILAIAENAPLNKLEERTVVFGLYNFSRMEPEYIQPVEKLVWYLSHTHLNSESELQVFKFGLRWVTLNGNNADTVLLILGCLDMTRITDTELNYMQDFVKVYFNSLAEKVVECLCMISNSLDVTVIDMTDNKTVICTEFTERVYTETLNIVTDSKKRLLEFKPCMALWSREQDSENNAAIMSNYLYTLHDNVFQPWLQVAEKDLWGWNAVAWSVTKIVIVCGERGRGTGHFWRGIKVYDVLKKEWTEHGVELPLRRHGGAAILNDSLYVVGGVGGYRVVLDSAIVYNLKEHTFRKIARFPDAIQNPTVCVFDKNVYASGHKDIYRYEDKGTYDGWVKVLETDIRLSCIIAYKDFLYCTQSYYNNIYRFKPNTDTKLDLVTTFNNSPSTICVVGDKLLGFASTDATQLAKVTVEEYSDREYGKTKVVWHRRNCIFTINDVAGSCAVVETIPPTKSEITPYLHRCIANYKAFTSQLN